MRNKKELLELVQIQIDTIDVLSDNNSLLKILLSRCRHQLFTANLKLKTYEKIYKESCDICREKSNWVYDGMPINFCPKCGRIINDEKVLREP